MTAAPRAPIDWGAKGAAALDWMLKYWWLIAGALLVLFVLNSCDLRTPFSPPSGREVAAKANQQRAEAGQRTAEAEAVRAQDSVVIIENTARARVRISRQVEEAREAVAEAPDLAARYAEYRDRAQRMRDESRAGVAAAVRQHAAEQPP